MKKNEKTTGFKSRLLASIPHRPGFRNKVKMTNLRESFLMSLKDVRKGIFGIIAGVEQPKMTTFERAIIGLLGLSTVSLILVALNTTGEIVPKSPKANLALLGTDMETASGAVGAVRSFKNGDAAGLMHLTVGRLSQTFSTLDYDLEEIREEGASVPRVFVVAMPQDLPRVRIPAERKRIFFKTVLPLILKANDDILKDRARLLQIISKGATFNKLPATDRLWLAAVSQRYKVKRSNFRELRRRIDIIPPSLALAQAAEESGWGTSRFALEGNALFGQWTFSTRNALVPKKRDDGKQHRVRAFTSLIDAVHAYVANLNTHRAYRELRQERQSMRKAGVTLSGNKLARTLTSYSERGNKYVRTLQSIIGHNQLQSLDKARLGGKTVSIDLKPVI